MTRDELEASFRRNLTELHVPRQFHNAVVEHFLPDADAYAATTVGEFGRYRAAHPVDPRPRRDRVHRRDGHYPGKTACGLDSASRQVTADKDLVTCQRCNPWAKEGGRG